MSISLIKLTNGTEIIGDLIKADEKILLNDPMQINYKQNEHSSLPSISFTRYCPFSTENMFQFDKSLVLHVTPIKKAVEDFYIQTLIEYKNTAEKFLENEFVQATSKMSSPEEAMYSNFLKKVRIDGYPQ